MIDAQTIHHLLGRAWQNGKTSGVGPQAAAPEKKQQKQHTPRFIKALFPIILNVPSSSSSSWFSRRFVFGEKQREKTKDILHIAIGARASHYGQL